MKMSKKETFTTTEIADMCQVATGTVREWIKKGDLPATEGENGRYIINREDAIAMAKAKWGEIS
jgi:excisionase family DNA binding protein